MTCAVWFILGWLSGASIVILLAREFLGGGSD